MFLAFELAQIVEHLAVLLSSSSPPGGRTTKNAHTDQQTKLVKLMSRAVLISLQKSGSCEWREVRQGALAQLGERLICIQEVRSSILLGSTKKQGPINHVGLALSADFAFGKFACRARVFALQKSLGSVAQVVRAHA